MAGTIELLNPIHNPNQIKVGERTISFMQSQTKLDETDKEIVIEEAMKILNHCVPSGHNGNITNIAVGYVQSGKTLSFTTLTVLAADNGYRMIVYLTGTKNNLQNQTAERLQNDLRVDEGEDYIVVNTNNNTVSIEDYIRNILEIGPEVLLFPILKHYLHINRLAEVFSKPELAAILQYHGVLIIDDEADQSSFNTYAKKNASKPDWEEDDFSKTYTSILNLKRSLPSHSYIQYTATPQAAFLIDSNDILSPTYHTVLTPGKGYTGGKFFFKNQDLQLISIIPDNEVYNNIDNPLSSMPDSLTRALKEFLISVAIVVLIQKRETFLSMMVHVDGRCDTNEKFSTWAQSAKQNWIDALRGPSDDFGTQQVRKSFMPAYNSITRYISNPPSFEQVMKSLVRAMVRTKVHLVQSRGANVPNQGISWESEKGHILVGADMLNRGFTIEHLSISYMPRTTKGKSNADTIEQRCRFFGYKMNYIDVCRVFLSTKSLVEYNDYVDHEESLRANLNQCESLAEFSKHSKAMFLADTLNPTRSNILTSRLVRNKLSGWKQMLSFDCYQENKIHVKQFLDNLQEHFTNCLDYNGNIIRNHRFSDIPIDKFIEFFKQFSYGDVPNITRRNVTIQYLMYLRDSMNITHVRLYEMAYQAKKLNDLRSHKVEGLSNIQMGYAANDSYPGDKYFKVKDTVCFQLHHYRINQPMHTLNNKDIYNFCIYYPTSLATSFVGTEDDDVIDD